MEAIKKLILEILSKGYVMSLATLDEGGIWVADVVYIFDTDYNIYWKSQVYTRHSKAIQKNSHVAATITTSVKGGKNEGLQIEGEVERIYQSTLEMFNAHLQKRLGDVPHTKYYDANDKLIDPEISWYRLRPKKIELIFEKYYEFDKQVIEF